MEPGLDPGISDAVQTAQSSEASAIVLEIDVSGGRMDVAQLAAGLIFESEVPVYALVRGKAWMAGALVALAADSVFMGPGSSIGGATGTGEDELSPSAVRMLRSGFRIVAPHRSREHQLAEAMVDPEISIDGVVNAGELLTLQAQEAVDRGMAAGQADVVSIMDGGTYTATDTLGVTGPEMGFAVTNVWVRHDGEWGIHIGHESLLPSESN